MDYKTVTDPTSSLATDTNNGSASTMDNGTAGTGSTSTSTSTTGPYVPAPWAFGKYSEPTRDKYLSRYTLILQSLAALITVIVLMWGLTRKDK